MTLLPAARHTFEAHTSEVSLALVAPTLESLYAEAGVGLADLMLGEIPQDVTGPSQPLSAQANDREALLVEWLNEIIFHSETEKRVFTRFQVERLTDQAISGTAWGVDPVSLKTAVKAATLHTLRIEQTADGWRARVVLDV